ncbi:MAG: hypothetical protein ABIU09_03575 [Pyrinomonadaceae bacterium]
MLAKSFALNVTMYELCDAIANSNTKSSFGSFNEGRQRKYILCFCEYPSNFADEVTDIIGHLVYRNILGTQQNT